MKNVRVPVNLQIPLGLIIALFMGYAFQSSWMQLEQGVENLTPIVVSPSSTVMSQQLSTPSSTVSPTVTTTPTPQPFQTLPGVWMVRLKLLRSAQPEIVNLRYLPEGRLTPTQPGDGRIQVLDKTGNLLFEQSFQVSFTGGEPLKAVDDISLIMTLPDVDGAYSIKIETLQGEVEQVLPLVE